MENKIDFDKELVKLYETLENNNFSFCDVVEQDGKYYLEINQYTPCGEDWIETIWFDGTLNSFIESLGERVENFDIDEEVEPLISQRGKGGCPSSISDLVEDARWKKDQLTDLYMSLKGFEMKSKYRVTIRWGGTWNYEVLAEDEYEAMELARTEFDKIPKDELVNTMDEVEVDSCDEL